MGNYSDILNLPHHVSQTHKPMSQHSRASQFSPFAALTGYEEIVAESARLTDSRRELSEYEQSRINEQLQVIIGNIGELPKVKITYFVPDKRKSGGEYVTASGCVRRVDEYEMTVIFTDSRSIPIADIYDIEVYN